jgi:ribosomal protein S14
MERKQIRLSRDEIRRVMFLKKELKRMILKSILKNQQLSPKIRGFALYKLQTENVYYSRQKNFCILTGKSGSVLKLTNTSRQMLNKLAQEGSVINVKTNNIK